MGVGNVPIRFLRNQRREFFDSAELPWTGDTRLISLWELDWLYRLADSYNFQAKLVGIVAANWEIWKTMTLYHGKPRK